MPQNLNSKYTIEIYDINNNLLADFSGRGKNRELKFVRNGTYTAQWTLDIDGLEKLARTTFINPKSILGNGQNTVLIKRLGVSIFGGVLMDDDGTIGDNQRTLTVQCVGWLELFNDRLTAASKIFTGIDAGTIAWTLINDAQGLTNGNWGITSGTIQASMNRDRTINYGIIKDEIVKLSALLNGFDFEFTPDRKFNVWYPQMGVTKLFLNFEYPGNIKSFQIRRSAKDIVNEVIVRGQGFGGAQTIVTRDDLASQSSYHLRQKLIDDSSVIETQTLNDHGDAILGVQKNLVKYISIKVDGNIAPIGSYWLGDRVPVVIHDLKLYDDINANYRIDEITVRINDLDSEEVELKVSL